MKIIKWTLIVVLLLALSPLMLLGVLCRLAKYAVSTGGDFADNVCDWLDRDT